MKSQNIYGITLRKASWRELTLLFPAAIWIPDICLFLLRLPRPVLYVHGNHDDKYERIPPEGCICIDDRIYVHEGVRILGLGGSMRYKPGNYQFTEREMKKRVRKLWPKLWFRGGFDILVTHAPAYSLNDGRDLPHQGFKIFLKLLDKYRPKYFLHGHVHMSYGRNHKRYDKYQDTNIINAYERCIFEFDTEEDEKKEVLGQE